MNNPDRKKLTPEEERIKKINDDFNKCMSFYLEESLINEEESQFFYHVLNHSEFGGRWPEILQYFIAQPEPFTLNFFLSSRRTSGQLYNIYFANLNAIHKKLPPQVVSIPDSEMKAKVIATLSSLPK